MLAITGVHLNVIGEENLTAQRPAVFIFNHRNQVDPVIAGALVHDNWIGVGKKELESDPIVGTLGKLTRRRVHRPRRSRPPRVETMHTVEERARKGLSMVIAPEGTRLDTTEVGPFKKGPFRLAMAAGIPIVPIVIRNAEIVAARNSTDAQSRHRRCRGVSADFGAGLDRRDLPERIAEVRQLYLDTLADWPVGELPEVALYKREKKAAAKEGPGEKDGGQGRAKAPTKKAPAKKAATKPRPAKANPHESQAAKTVRHNGPPRRPSAPNRQSRPPKGSRDRTGRRYQRGPHRPRLAGIGVHGLAGRDGTGDGLDWLSSAPTSRTRNSTCWNCRRRTRRRRR